MTDSKPFDPVHAAAHGYTREDWDAVDSPELTDEELAQARPMSEAMPELFAAMVEETRRRGQVPPKVPVQIALDRDVAERLEASGPGWHARVNEALRRHLDEREAGREADAAA